MQKFNVKLMVAALVLSIGAIANVNAQVDQGITLNFYLATDFVVNGTSFPAGE